MTTHRPYAGYRGRWSSHGNDDGLLEEYLYDVARSDLPAATRLFVPVEPDEAPLHEVLGLAAGVGHAGQLEKAR